MQRQASRNSTKYQSGFTLIELMIAMVIGLFLIGGIITVFVGNQTTANVKQQLDETQESIRFSAYTISRLVRNALEFSSNSDNAKIQLIFPADMVGVLDCKGEEVVLGTQIIIEHSVIDKRLTCQGVDGTAAAIALNVTGVEFTYGYFDSSGVWVEPDPQVPNDSQTTSVKSVISVQPNTNFAETDITFYATIRHKVLF